VVCPITTHAIRSERVDRDQHDPLDGFGICREAPATDERDEPDQKESCCVSSCTAMGVRVALR